MDQSNYDKVWELLKVFMDDLAAAQLPKQNVIPALADFTMISALRVRYEIDTFDF